MPNFQTLKKQPEGYEKLESTQLPQIITIKGKGSITYTHDVVWEHDQYRTPGHCSSNSSIGLKKYVF